MSVLFLEKNVVDNLNEAGIRDVIAACQALSKYQRLQAYYEGKHAILEKFSRDNKLPNNKIVNNVPKFVTDTLVGYFMGSPVAYSSEDKELLRRVQDIFTYNDEQDHNMELAKTASIKGRAYEMLYIDEDRWLRFVKIEPESLVLIKDSETKQPIAALRTSHTQDLKGDTRTLVEWWTWTDTMRFASVNGGQLHMVALKPNFWQDVPFVEYLNNEEGLGDFEGILGQVDAYNQVQSNTANLFQYNDAALLKIAGMGDVTTSDIAEMKEKGAIILEGDGDIDWIMKSIDDNAQENYKNRLFDDMHIFTGVPNMADESFGTNLSGVAMDYKLWNMEQVRAIKERKFKKGLQRRIELIARYLDVLGYGYDYRDISIEFRQNKPQNLPELVEVFAQLAGDVSHETRLKMLPLIENVQDELARLKKEQEAERREFGQHDQLVEALSRMREEDADEQPPDAQPVGRAGQGHAAGQ